MKNHVPRTQKVIDKSLPKFKQPKTFKMSTQTTGHVTDEEGGMKDFKCG